MFMLLMSVAVFIALLALLTRTRIGLIIQAALTQAQHGRALGHNVPRIFMLVFGGGTALAGLAGVIAGRPSSPQPGMAASRSAASCSWSSWSAGSARWAAPSSPRC
jgi:branched-chain amino acid transport system permease protein